MDLHQILFTIYGINRWIRWTVIKNNTKVVMRELPMLSYGLADTHKPTMQSPLSKHSFVLIQYSVKN